MKTSQIPVTDPVGLHARPAALFSNLASQFESEIMICNLSTAGDWANAKSILSVLTCGVLQGHLLGIRAEGPDEDQALQALERLVRAEFAGENV